MMLAEIAEVYEELCTLACKCIAGVSEANGERAVEQARRYQDAAAEAQQVVNAQRDLQVKNFFLFIWLQSQIWNHYKYLQLM